MLAVFAAFVTSCGPAPATPDHGGSAPRAGSPSRQGEILFVRAERRAMLEAMLPARRQAWCGATDLRPLLEAARRPVPGLGGVDERPDPASEPFAHAVMVAVAAGFGDDDPAARDGLAELLEGWARADALTATIAARTTANGRYALDRTLLPAIVAFWLLGDDPALAPPERRRVAAWLGRLVRLRGEPGELRERGATTARNNHLYLRASVDMAWAALTGDDDRWRGGLAAYRQALRDMRPDGSLPLETRRGARALWYQRHALASLVTIAEMAAVQGQDLYGLEVDGRTVHTAVRFLLDAVDDPRRVWRYAAANERPGPEGDPRRQDLGFLARRGHGRHYMAWAEIYMARFPERRETRRLRELLERSDPDFRPMIDDYSGGNTTCFFASSTETQTAP
jgi:poly(beta-D-mannuronate) lyase